MYDVLMSFNLYFMLLHIIYYIDLGQINVADRMGCQNKKKIINKFVNNNNNKLFTFIAILQNEYA